YGARGWPVDAALGRIDTADVAGWGYAASLQLWDRLLNCGFRLPPTAGADVFLYRLQKYPPGVAPALCRLPNGLSYSEWIHGQQLGHTFVSTGPMLEFSAEGNHQSGDTLKLETPAQLRVRARAWSQYPLQNLEVILSGKVVLSNKPDANSREIALDTT